ncbi:mitochondrion protein [Ophiostoma piceae UAMH 11346]|uniref:MICOS complex subunit MIC60 n=1 Tax=Ophiostoma piceae (strain UAMH 11346) TaxID=1262450 RepID=S3C9N6_OPHP1|nr:mitochondrion protein [Ophiostoma piceae UAMH 11346]
MLRTSLQSARAVGGRPLASASAASARQWRNLGAAQRFYADIKPPVLPASATNTAATTPPPSPSKIAAATIPASKVPLTPPPPPPVAPPTPRRKGGFFRKLRNYVLTISILGALTFGGGVWYSRVNDNFHDFFTEYVPYGEQAVLYLEELDFRKRFPNIVNRNTTKARDTGSDIRVPAQSGASWRVADPETTRQKKASSTSSPAVVAKPAAAEPAKAEVIKKVEPVPVAATPVAAAPVAATPFRAPEVDEPSRWPPASPIDPLGVNDAAEPVVQDVVRLLNDIITVINADKAADKFGATIGKAKEQVNKVGRKVRDIRAAAETSAASQVAARTEAFDKAARDLLARVESAMASQEAQWRVEFDEEMQRVRESYDARVQLATERERELSQGKLQNKLLEQAVQMTQQFTDELSSRVEAERKGRLGKLEQLSASVSELERLTAGWTDVVDASQRAQQLHVAIDAVKARLAADDANPSAILRPFVRELVAVKEIASTDPVVDAAIASIPPAAYQRGIASTAELIERFRRVSSEVRKASLLPEDAGVASHASSYVLSKVLFKKNEAGSKPADDGEVESILVRTQSFLEEGNLDDAAREMNGLKGWAKTLSRDWLGEVRKVLEVQQALDVITAEARLRSLQLEKSR